MCGGGERVTSAGLELRVKDAFEEGIWVPSAGLSDVPRIITGPTYLSMGTDSQTSVQKVFFSPPYQCTSPFPHFAADLIRLPGMGCIQALLLSGF